MRPARTGLCVAELPCARTWGSLGVVSENTIMMKIALRGNRNVPYPCRRIGERRGLPRRSLMRVVLGRRLRLFFLLKLEDA